MKYRSILILSAFFALALASCKKDGDLAPIAPLKAGFNIINAGTDTVNFFQNGTRLNNISPYFPGGTLGYLTVNAGEQSYQLKKAGSANVLLDTKYTLQDSTLNSLFIAGASADKIFMTPDLIYGDTTSLKSAQVRFVNASPEASYDVKIGAGFVFANQAFKSATNFIIIPPGNSVLTINPAGVATPLLTRTLNLAAGKAYTVYTRGKAGGTGNSAFAAVLITNY